MRSPPNSAKAAFFYFFSPIDCRNSQNNKLLQLGNKGESDWGQVDVEYS
jgi:hypothetical protein